MGNIFRVAFRSIVVLQEDAANIKTARLLFQVKFRLSTKLVAVVKVGSTRPLQGMSERKI